MAYLIITSILWAFSFGLVKKELMGVDPAAISTLRLALATLCFLPFLRLKKITLREALELGSIGMVQFGLMYVLYLESFKYLKSFEIALFTVLTPIYVVLVGGLLEKRLNPRYLLASVVAILGAAIVLDIRNLKEAHLLGFLIVQACNLCFAAGQVAWCRARKRMEMRATDAQLFALPYAGGLMAAGLCSIYTAKWSSLDLNLTQVGCIVYLGIVASGICFYLWNVGAQKVNTGTLAVMNNLKLPLAILCSLLFFKEQADLGKLTLGGSIIVASIWLTQRTAKAEK